MNAIAERSHLPSPIEPGEHRKLIATERLHNQVVDYIKSPGAGFTRDAVNTVGGKVVRTLRVSFGTLTQPISKLKGGQFICIGVAMTCAGFVQYGFVSR